MTIRADFHFDLTATLTRRRRGHWDQVLTQGVTLSNSPDWKRQLSRRHVLANLGIDQMGNKTCLSDSPC
jgi:hypothetical protein